MPQETDGGVYNQPGLDASEPGVDASYPVDPALGPNTYPKETGSDTYQDIPGDGVVPG